MSYIDEVLKRKSFGEKLKFFKDLQKLPTAPAALARSVSRATPKEFILDVLGERPTKDALSCGYEYPWTPDQSKVYDSIANGATRIAVYSGHGCGKSALAARVALWGLYAADDTTVITTAPTKRQVEEVLWKQIRELFRDSKTRLPGRMLKTKIVINDSQFAYGFTAAVGNEDLAATKAQGQHAKNRTIIIVDEAAGVDDLILDSLGSMTQREGDILLLLGNPTAVGSWYHKACLSWPTTFSFSCLNHPNVLNENQNIIPGATTKKWCTEKREELGEESPLYRVRVLGDWPDQSSETLISLGWWNAAQQRYNKFIAKKEYASIDSLGCSAGLDISDTGGDLTVLSVIDRGVWKIPIVKGKPTWHVGRDVMQAVQLVLDCYDDGVPIRILCLDDGGVGRGVTARLRQLQNEGKLPRFAIINRKKAQTPWIMPINFGQSAFSKDKFVKAKDEMWWNAREMFRTGKIMMPDDDTLASYKFPTGQSLERQMTAPIYGPTTGGKTIIFDKRSSGGGAQVDPRIREQIRHLPDGSPDIAHSCILSMWGWKMLGGSPKLDHSTPPSSPEEWFDAQVRAALDEGNRRRLDRRMPWQG